MRTIIWAVLTCLPFMAFAQEGEIEGVSAIGTARLFTNDFLGDGADRWRTGSYQLSHIRGPHWSGAAPAVFGAIREYRLRTEIVAAENLTTPAPDDRKYAGLISFGVHTHNQVGGVDLSLGADVVFIGPQTGIGRFQKAFHEVVGAPAPDLSDQIKDHIFLNLSGAAARSYALGETGVMRPYVEAQVGHETYARLGADVVFGGFGRDGMLTRDVVTGTLMRADPSAEIGYSVLLGGDIAYVDSSVLLPSGGPDLLKDRSRVRAGIQWQGAKSRTFYGLTWLSPEFKGQSEGQFVGSVMMDFSF